MECGFLISPVFVSCAVKIWLFMTGILYQAKAKCQGTRQIPHPK